MEWYVIDVRGSDGKMKQLLTPVPPAIAFESGLLQEAIVGEVRPSRAPQLPGKSDGIDPETFAHNPQFLNFLHQVLAKHVPANPGLREAARQQGDGHCYIVDGRSPGFANGDVPSEDIVAEISVQGGHVQGYRPSPSYRPVSKNGLMRLEPYFESRLVDELKHLISGADGSANRVSHESDRSRNGGASSREDMSRCRTFVSPAGDAGVALGTEPPSAGAIYNLFVAPSAQCGSARTMLSLALHEGGNHLHCVDHPVLVDFLQSLGFQTETRTKSNSSPMVLEWMDWDATRQQDEPPDVIGMICNGTHFDQLDAAASVSKQHVCSQGQCGGCGCDVSSETRHIGLVAGYHCHTCGYSDVWGHLTLGPAPTGVTQMPAS